MSRQSRAWAVKKPKNQNKIFQICEEDETDPGVSGVGPEQYLGENKEKSRAKVIITGGTMTLLLLAASLVTTSFLMSPVIEGILGIIFNN